MELRFENESFLNWNQLNTLMKQPPSLYCNDIRIQLDLDDYKLNQYDITHFDIYVAL